MTAYELLHFLLSAEADGINLKEAIVLTTDHVGKAQYAEILTSDDVRFINPHDKYGLDNNVNEDISTALLLGHVDLID